MHNLPDDIRRYDTHPLSPFCEEWWCPECGANENDSDCVTGHCVTKEKERTMEFAEWIANELANDRPVFDGERHWTFDDVQACVDEDEEVARLHRMLMLATSNLEKERAASAYQLVFRRNALKLAEEIAGDLMILHGNPIAQEAM